MIKSPRFKPHLTPVVLPDEGVLLLAEDSARALHGRLYERIAPLLDGTHSIDDLVKALSDEYDAAHVYYALMLLEKNGHLCEPTPDIADDLAAFWSGLGLDASAAVAALAEKPVALHSLGAVDLTPLHAALTRLGVNIQQEKAALTVVVTDSYQHPELMELNAAFHAAGQSWLILKPTGHDLWLGPLYQAEDPGCHACLVKRLSLHRQVQDFAARQGGSDGMRHASHAGLPATQHLMAELTALEMAKFLTGAPVSTAAAVLSLDARTLVTHIHQLLPDPSCSVCGSASEPVMRPVTLVPRKVHFMQDGGHRHVTPEQTLKTYEHLVSPITGIVGQLHSVEESEIAQVYIAGHNHAFKVERLEDLKRSLRNASAGKGVSAVQAKASALCEALERYSGERQGDEVIVTASYRQMQATHGEDVIHPNAVMAYSARQQTEHAAWNARKSKFNRVPEALDEDLPIDWTPVWSLTHDRHRYLPTQLLYYRSPASADCDRFFAMGCSNGNASGNTLEEAVLQGFFELVERDATALWWYNRLRKPGVDVASFGEPWLLDLVEHYNSLGRDSWALDLTSDLGIPCFVAISRLRDTAQDRLLFGLGCHLDARIALQRSFAEMNQMLGLAQERPEADASAIEDEETRRWLTTATLENQRYMGPDPERPVRCYADFVQRHTGDMLTDISTCRNIIEAQGMEMLVLDQTRADAKMPVVKVIVPGLRHFWARYGAGRLYDVPVAMGWLEQPLTEDELNPIPIFL